MPAALNISAALGKAFGNQARETIINRHDDLSDECQSREGFSPHFSGHNAIAWAHAYATGTFIGHVYVSFFDQLLKSINHLVILCLVFAGIIGCVKLETPECLSTIPPKSHPVATGTLFHEIAETAGVRFLPRNGCEAGHRSILESLGSGVGLFDYDLDGTLDILLPGGGTFSEIPSPIGLPAALFRNRGRQRFERAEREAGVVHVDFYSHGVCTGDMDSDGFFDVLMTGYRGLLLLKNCGDGTFVDATLESGLSLKSWSTSAAWGDADLDGVLDLYVVNYVDWSFDKHPTCFTSGNRDICAPKEFEPLSDILYFGNGDGTFRDVSSTAGLLPGGKGLGVVSADLDHDGDLDYYVANDSTPNFLYRNDGRGHFDEIGLVSGTAFGETGESEGSMGVDVGDYNGDGLPDICVANYENQSIALYRNEQECRFQHVSNVAGITAVGSVCVGFGILFFDFDNDGDEDLIATNGHVMNHPANASVRQCPLLFENREGRRFVNVAGSAGEYLSTPHLGRGMACGDVDGDGDVDLIISHTNEPVALLDNQSDNSSNWLGVRLIGTRSHRDAIGARVTVATEHRKTTRQIKGGASYLSSSTNELKFGLGHANAVVSVEVTWPGNRCQTVMRPPINRLLTVIEFEASR